ncbi:putative RAB geranylgeranyl transferase [Cryptosporidium canis]|uniref:Geranylgeranyl transferase type II subunit beta n=1 Tax=Cryptosporidium canis TaxID=195482 RepID=A0ABQ8P400_9CRYT|nr:putative RAB geranylgeranyl transferase [Cryptosporidium canis]KAJ1609616.1 putative RAB geranylgeranyl transferase [Cryptosporidium canis]
MNNLLQTFNLELHKEYLTATTHRAIYNNGSFQTEFNSVFIHGMYWVLCCSNLIKFDILNELNIKEVFNYLLENCERELCLDGTSLRIYSINPSDLVTPSILSLLSGTQINALKKNQIVESNIHATNKFIKSLSIFKFDKIYINHSKNCLIQQDIRFVYSALLISYLSNSLDFLRIKQTLPISKLINLLNGLQNKDGGFGRRKNDESHAGYTFCAVASIAIIKRISVDDDINIMLNFNRLNRWLLKRVVVSESHIMSPIDQSYCFNGRTGKKCDVCYSWWVTASLKMLEYINPESNNANFISSPKVFGKLINGVLCHQNNIYGGFQKTPFIFDSRDHSDPLHTFLSISALSLLTNNYLEHPDSNSYKFTRLTESLHSISKIDPVSVLPGVFSP